MKERRRNGWKKKRADWEREIEGFPLPNQKQLSERQQFRNKCFFTVSFQNLYDLSKGLHRMTGLDTVCRHKHNACAFLHAVAFSYFACSDTGTHSFSQGSFRHSETCQDRMSLNESSKSSPSIKRFCVLILHENLTGPNNSTSQSNAEIITYPNYKGWGVLCILFSFLW